MGHGHLRRDPKAAREVDRGSGRWIGDLGSTSVEDVRDVTPTHNRQFLERRIAYKLQEIEFRKIDRNMLDRNKRRIQAILESGQNKKFDRDIRLMAGTVLTREYQGKEYRVMATVNGQYEFDGRCYQSLSRIAKEITGTAWSGPMFFGLKSTAAKKATGKKGAGK